MESGADTLNLSIRTKRGHHPVLCCLQHKKYRGGLHHMSNIRGERAESNVKSRGQRMSDVKGRGQRVRRQGQKLESQSRVEDRDRQQE